MEGVVNMANEDVEGTTKVDDGGSSEEQTLQEERKKMTEEFNQQRARMKELFLQKEEELRQLLSSKQQLESEVLGLRAQLQQLQTLSENQSSEIESLQLLIHETVEASSSGSLEVRRLQTRNLELEQQLNLIAKQQQAQDAALAPAALVRSIARKLGADTEQDEVAKKAQDDAELLRSLVEPLEEEIKVLKDKLRDTDTQLQKQLAVQNKAGKGDAKVSEPASSSSAAECDMCQNYEKQLVDEQARSRDATGKAKDLERALKVATDELEGCRCSVEETARAWRTERAETQRRLAELQHNAERCRELCTQRTAAANQCAQTALQQVTALTVQRETLQEELDRLQRENDMLLGKYTKKAMELQNEDIDLPDTVEELQEHALKLHEAQICITLGREALEAELVAARSQLAQCRVMEAQYHETRQQLEQLEQDRLQLNDLGEKLTRANDKTEELLEDKRRLQNEVQSLQSRVPLLQQQLDSSEKVQRDFVRLSQTLQVQLERLRTADEEVRWQDPVDVHACTDCNSAFPSDKHKQHCRHCGRVHCAACLKPAPSRAAAPRSPAPRAPAPRVAPVCSLCYTLLCKEAPPHFSSQDRDRPGDPS